MKILAFSLILMLSLLGPGKIGQINAVKAEAKAAFQSGDFKTAVAKYKYLIDTLGVKEDEVMMNMANAYFRANDTLNAFNSYLPLTTSNNSRLKSLAFNQMGVLSNRQGKLEEALAHFKEALKAAPANDEARFNYEMVKKKLEEQKKKDQQKKDQNKDQKDDKKDQKKDDKKEQDKKDEKKDDKKDQKKDDKKDQDKKDQDKKDQDKKDQDKKDQDKKDQDKKNQDKKDQDKKDQEKEQKDKKENPDKDNKDKKDIPPSVSEKLKDMQMTEDKAKMILEAMKNQEMQYLQQNKRKATKPKEKSKPDW